jgi:hypothetical protein
VTSAPGWISLVSGSAAAAIMTRGPRISPLAAASGSRTIVPRNCSAASPILIVSPSLAPSRSRIAGSTTAPKTP